MNTKQAHSEAMKYLQEAIITQEMGNDVSASSLFEKAFVLEKEAALYLVNDFENEPTRSVLFRSAANLAMDCHNYKEAQEMVNHGLAGYPPPEIAEELRDIYEKVNFYRHFELKGVTLLWIKGTLKVADAEKNSIKIITNDNKSYIVTVPQGLNDIVRSYWGEAIKVYISKNKRKHSLIEIAKM